MKKSIVSVITPCYNVSRWIDRYMESIANQTYKHLQLIFINDGSTDDSEDKILAYKSKFENEGIEFVYQYQENGGVGAAVNAGLKLIKGDYFTWCDSDNFYTNDYFECKVDFFENNPQYSIVRCDGYIVNENNLDVAVTTMACNNTDKFNEKLFYNAIEEKNFHFGCAMVKTADFDQVNKTREIYPSRQGQNWQILLPMFYFYKSGYIDKPMFYFVEREGSVSNIEFDIQRKIEQLEEYERILLKTIETMEFVEKQQCIDKVRIKYSKKIIPWASAYQQKEILKTRFNLLKNMKALTLLDRLLYIRGTNDFLYNVYEKIKN